MDRLQEAIFISDTMVVAFHILCTDHYYVMLLSTRQRDDGCSDGVVAGSWGPEVSHSSELLRISDSLCMYP